MRTALWLLLITALGAFSQARAAEEPPLTVEALQCRGNASTSCSFILGQLYLNVGDRVDEEEIENAKLRLSFLRNFNAVSIYLERGSARGQAVVVVEVSEASPITTESTLALAMSSTLTQFTAARISDYNLFGRGKILDFSASYRWSLNDGPAKRTETARLQYIDPHLFDSKRNFLVVGTSYLDLHNEYESGLLVDRELFGIDVQYGRRLWDFSYATIGYQYRPVSRFLASMPRPEGVEISTEAHKAVVLASYGWNSVDDPYFPTRGSRLGIGIDFARGRADGSNIFASKVWQTKNGSVWSLSYDEPDTFGVRLARPLDAANWFGGTRRARWYVAAGYQPVDEKPDGDDIFAVYAQVGVRFETQSFGIVELRVFGNHETNRNEAGSR